MPAPTTPPRTDRADAFALVRTQSATMPTSMRAIADAVLQDPKDTANGSAADLAERANVSAATVSRFARHLGFASYAELQRSMTRAVERGIHQHAEIHAGVGVDDDVATVIAKVTEDVRAVMTDTRAALDPAALGEAANAVRGARRVVLYGVGASGIVARDLHLKLERIGIASSITEDPHNALTLASVLGPDDVLVITSHSGTTTEVLEVATEAKMHEATVVAITGHANAPLTRHADHVLLGVAGAESDLRPAAMGSRMSQLAIVDALFIVVAQRTDDRSRPLLARSRAAVRTHHRS
ncbi:MULTISPECIES: MurR/RpiR family transcriptional regulator [unclassified Curtobacterium]|uniref:MurR/RpiR family transcriptional regulator n=1 Tax=unclassified Curtobacterium TaxID=257496 RepID=UPI00382E3B8B